MDSLTPAGLRRDVAALAEAEPLFREILSRHGEPPLWQRPRGLHTLLHIVVEQKISIESARAVMKRIERLVARAAADAVSAGSVRQESGARARDRPSRIDARTGCGKSPTGDSTGVDVPAVGGVGADAYPSRREAARFTGATVLRVPVAALVEAGLSRAKANYCHDIARAVDEGRLDLPALDTLPDDAARRQLVAVRGIGPWTAGVYVMLALCRRDGWASGDRALALSLAECEGLDAVPDYPTLDARAEAWRPMRGAAARLLWHAYLERRGRRVPA